MTLSAMLSAMRSLILDEPAAPLALSERSQFLRELYPNLSPLEADDLARIQPEKLEIYTSTIFRGETNLLRRLFPITFALLEVADHHDKTFNSYDFVKEMHRHRPWKTATTIGLADALCTYLREDIRGSLPNATLISEVSEFERISLRVARANCAAELSASIAELATLTVEELLEETVHLPNNCASLWSRAPLLELRAAQRRGDPLALDNPGNETVCFLASRDASQTLHWNQLPREVGQLLEQKASEPFLVEDLAIAAIEPYGALPEQERFTIFFELFQLLLAAGALVVPPRSQL